MLVRKKILKSLSEYTDQSVSPSAHNPSPLHSPERSGSSNLSTVKLDLYRHHLSCCVCSEGGCSRLEHTVQGIGVLVSTQQLCLGSHVAQSH